MDNAVCRPKTLPEMTLKNNPQHCPFCRPDFNHEVLLENEQVFAIYDKYPVSKGHALIIPRRHCADYFDLSSDERSACWDMVSEVKDILEKEYHPNGYNIGVNIHETAGQTVPHVHIHLIPRYTGDMKNPEGGVRGAIPEKRLYRKR